MLFDVDYFGQSGYHWAAKRGYTLILNVLILGGNHINLLDNKRRTPLFLAAQWNNYEICELLLNQGANPFILNIDEKRAIDMTTNKSVKTLLFTWMDVNTFLFI